MRYRIKIITFKNGRKEYVPQVRRRFIWMGLDYDGFVSIIDLPCDTREDALKRIDKNFEGNTKVQKIEFEYIQK